jgi:hypothetical protein
MKQRKLISTAEAVPAKAQHKKACSDCPWARTALPGWLGGATAEQWVACAHSDEKIECHTLTGAECAGAAIYRANVAKSLRDPQAFRLPADPVKVFASPAEFKAHHGRSGGSK